MHVSDLVMQYEFAKKYGDVQTMALLEAEFNKDPEKYMNMFITTVKREERKNKPIDHTKAIIIKEEGY